jgi:hypothetical protein
MKTFPIGLDGAVSQSTRLSESNHYAITYTGSSIVGVGVESGGTRKWATGTMEHGRDQLPGCIERDWMFYKTSGVKF